MKRQSGSGQEPGGNDSELGAEPYFIGPEIPGVVPEVPAYKLDKKIRPQAARFRVWAYRKENGKLVPASEVLPGRGTGRVTFSPSERWPLGPDGRPVIDYLGELRTDEAGRLLVIGGMGLRKSRREAPDEAPLENYANNDDGGRPGDG